jgi:hypothetical protein
MEKPIYDSKWLSKGFVLNDLFYLCFFPAVGLSVTDLPCSVC